MQAIAVIPARLGSTRLPRKVLREIAGRPMLAWVYDAVRSAGRLDRVIVATDSEEVLALCRANNWEAQMTSPAHRSGTERLYEIAQRIAADLYINVQGDEPLLRREHIEVSLDLMQQDGVRLGTLKTPMRAEDAQNP